MHSDSSIPGISERRIVTWPSMTLASFARSISSMLAPMITSANAFAEPSAIACPLVRSAHAMKKSVAKRY
jgi:hypothetical protein